MDRITEVVVHQVKDKLYKSFERHLCHTVVKDVGVLARGRVGDRLWTDFKEPMEASVRTICAQAAASCGENND